MPISAFLKDEKDENHNRIKTALNSLYDKKIEYEDKDSWQAYTLIERPYIGKRGEYVSFRISPFIAKAFLNFTKGYSKYELATAMKFDSIYSMRFYELLSNQKRPITYSIKKLKIMFQIENKYKKNNDFFKRVIEPAKRELDKISPYTFEYSPIKTGLEITSIKFFPIYQPEHRDSNLQSKDLEKKTSLSWDLETIIINYLKETYIFSDEEIKNNRKLFIQAQDSTKFDLLIFLSENKIQAAKKANPKGWIIGAIKKQLNQS